jgi:hypothetical protein
MNNYRNFKERAETMKALFLAGIPNDVISEVTQLSEATIQEDRRRIAKHYGIEVPKPLSHYLIDKDHYKFFFRIYLQAKIHRDYNDPLYKAAGIIIDIDSIEEHLNSLQSFYEALMCTYASIKSCIDKNNMNLIEKLLKDYKKKSQSQFEKEYGINFQYEFFTKMYLGDIPYESFGRVSDVKQAATKYFAEKKGNRINTLRIENPQALLLPFLSVLNEEERKILVERYGLDSKTEKSLVKIAEELKISKMHAENVCRRAYTKVYHELEEVSFYPFDSSGRMEHFEKKYNNITELRTRKYKVTKKVADKVTNKKQLTKNLDWIEKAASYPTHSAKVTFLIQRTKDVHMSKELTYKSKFKGCKYIIDIVENWDALNLDESTSEAMDKFLKENRVDRKRVSENDILLARRIIQKESEK